MDRSPVDRALEAFADRHGVRVVAARDVGSRAWNLADADSDYDVGLVYVQHPAEYATLAGHESSLELTRGECECRGWNVDRFAELVADSNPTAFEFLHSPRRYREFGPLEGLERDVGDSFAPMALFHHYRSLALRQYRKYLQGRLLEREGGDLAYRILEERDGEYLVEPAGGDGERGDIDREAVIVPKGAYPEAAADRTVRRHLHVARGVCYAAYVRETHRFPPLDFPAFLESVDQADLGLEASFLERARDLAERKRRGEGDAVVGRLFDPDEIRLPDLDPAEHAGRTVDRERIDAFVRETLERTYDLPPSGR